MIKPEDLRIGNWVEFDNRYFQINSIATVFPTLKTIEFGIGVVDWNNIDPIPLTEKMLLGCGFKKRKHLEDYFIELSDNCILSVTLDGVVFICGSNQQRILLPMTKYLHNLQNLHKELSKTELIINLWKIQTN